MLSTYFITELGLGLNPILVSFLLIQKSVPFDPQGYAESQFIKSHLVNVLHYQYGYDYH